MDKITFALFSYNDEARIELLVRNVKKFGQVIVFDDSSTDNTKAVVERLGVPFIVRPKTQQAFVEAPETYEFVKPYIKTPWLYWGWTDNLLPKTLLEKMVEISLQDSYKRVYLPVYTYMWGDVTHVLAKAKYPNFFRKDFVDFKNNHVHGFGNFYGKPEEELSLPYRDELAIKHFSLYDLNKFVLSHLRYANLEVADKLADKSRTFSLRYTFGSMFRYFFIFFRYGWRSGTLGLLNAMLYANFRLMVAVRLYEEKNNLNLQTIEAEFTKAKQKIVEEVEK